MVLLVVLFVLLVVVVGAGAYFYSQYSEEIGVVLDLKGRADVLFERGVVGPRDCSSYLGCVKYCLSRKDECVKFCEDNSENELCVLVVDALGSGELSLEEEN